MKLYFTVTSLALLLVSFIPSKVDSVKNQPQAIVTASSTIERILTLIEYATKKVFTTVINRSVPIPKTGEIDAQEQYRQYSFKVNDGVRNRDKDIYEGYTAPFCNVKFFRHRKCYKFLKARRIPVKWRNVETKPCDQRIIVVPLDGGKSEEHKQSYYTCKRDSQSEPYFISNTRGGALVYDLDTHNNFYMKINSYQPTARIP